MQLGMGGLGKMGANMTVRLLRDGHELVCFDVNEDNVESIASQGATAVASLEDLVSKLTAPRAVWVMVPSGDISEDTIQELAGLGRDGDLVVDGGNSRFTDTRR